MELLYAFYGDDFTGSTDVLEQLASHGVPAVLFLREPTSEQMSRFAGVRAIGWAGDSRSRGPAWMDEHLPGVFGWLKGLGAAVVQYKVCSTFDSSPVVGSIGRAMEIGIAVFGAGFVPVVVGAPHLRRYVAFGNLFAAGPDGVVVRVDRGVMRRHPVTPMVEGDLQAHLAMQSSVPVALVDVTELDGVVPGGVVLFDTVDEEMLGLVGKRIWERRPWFGVGSSGMTAALIRAWGCGAAVGERAAMEGPLLVVSGSCSVVTAGQIRYGLGRGYVGVRVDPAAVDAEGAVAALEAGKDVVAYTALGAADGDAAGLGAALGRMLLGILRRTGVRRVLLCGGDTASHAVQELGLYALTWVGRVQAGAPLCRAHGGELDGLEMVLKGGQVGTEDFFDWVKGDR